MITGLGHKVMCDLKIFDIPETVKLAVKQLKNRGVTFVTVHGNDPILKAAVKEKNGIKILSVTVLTSFGEEEMRDMGFTGTIKDFVLKRAKRALELGCDGIVSSGLEASSIRNDLGNNFIIVTPGIRPGQNIEIKQDDQRRIVTAKEAIMNGADYVVIGRPISTAKDPVAMVKLIQEEIKDGLSQIS